MHSIYNYQIQTLDWDNLKQINRKRLVSKHSYINFVKISLNLKYLKKNNSEVLTDSRVSLYNFMHENLKETWRKGYYEQKE